MTRPTQKSFTLFYFERNMATEKIEHYLNEIIDKNQLKQDVLGLLLAKHLPIFANEISPEIYEQELMKSLLIIRGISSTLEQELERTRQSLNSSSLCLENLPKSSLHVSSQWPTTNNNLTNGNPSKEQTISNYQSNNPLINDNDVTEDEESPIMFEEEKDDEKDDDSSNRTQRILDNFPDYPV